MEVNHRHLKKTVLQDSMILWMEIILFILLEVGSGFILLLTFVPIWESEGSVADIWFMRILMTICGLTMPICIILEPTRYVVWVTFTTENIEFHTIARRKKIVPYSRIPYICYASYLHTVYTRYYIIFSSRRLSEKERAEINHVKPTEYLIKIRYSKKTAIQLVEILPTKQRAAIETISRILSSL